ncbi:hypothetical protein A3C18_03425 [Candidatus Kaiserbacteria bacterium RIFCSPHIGHO2_02_FULL_54_11b]|uniref:dTDP-4-dehydrorhamnose reductase n=2 Tax=Candidatus Kaiseribacteriota TaxID=1752734 RepID=A0A1F6CRC4_9BACT|nr:MAG: hypothetical protein A2704_05200 [Candidatus Kaiserbacteria bacterium RIFCSPHIGHO2_01_FULL_54_36b]OGG64644.1 MAG: hypothetical protein A3C18_03425 [Candidatus Kaiserbacteria bacterium RIFCSPHIGHO2_02_FULL_54_11b]
MKSFDFGQVLSTGASGMIGSYVDFGIRTDRTILDILDCEAVTTFVKKHKPRAIIHLAGATDMVKTEQDPLYAYELNVRGTYNVAQAAESVGATMVLASSSRVFDGHKKGPYTEDDAPDPQTHYGRTKYISELIVASLTQKYIIARTAWVFGGGPARDNKFFGKVLAQFGGDEIEAIDDLRGSPTYGKDYITAIKALLCEGAQGIFHIANRGEATRADLAEAMAAQLKPALRVVPVAHGHFKSADGLPANESMQSKRYTMRPWREALAEYLREEWEPYLHAQKII